MQLKFIVILISCGLLSGCYKWKPAEDEVSIVPVTNNPYVAPEIMNAQQGAIPF